MLHLRSLVNEAKILPIREYGLNYVIQDYDIDVIQSFKTSVVSNQIAAICRNCCCGVDGVRSFEFLHRSYLDGIFQDLRSYLKKSDLRTGKYLGICLN